MGGCCVMHASRPAMYWIRIPVWHNYVVFLPNALRICRRPGNGQRRPRDSLWLGSISNVWWMKVLNQAEDYCVPPIFNISTKPFEMRHRRHSHSREGIALNCQETCQQMWRETCGGSREASSDSSGEQDFRRCPSVPTELKGSQLLLKLPNFVAQ